MIWRVILFWLLGVVSTFANFPRHSTSFSLNLPTPVNLQYDVNGNLSNDGTRSFSYDAENQLTNVNVPGQWQVGCVYDGSGRRRIRRAYSWQSGTWLLTNETDYIYDGSLVIQERDTNGNVLVSYTRGLDLSGSLQGAGGIGGLLARTDTNGTTYYHCDGNGNITAMIDGNQNIVARYEYDAFGRLIGMWGSMASVNTYRFSSKEYDSLTGLYYYGNRYYDPVLQRWLNRDPIGEAGGINLYGFVRNSPVNFVDPFGLTTYYSTIPYSYSQVDTYGPYAQYVDDGSPGVVYAESILDPEFYGGGGMQTQDAMLLAIVVPVADPVGMILGKLLGPIVDPIADALGLRKPPCPTKLHRPYIRDWVRNEVEAAAPRASDGRFIDPNTQLPTDDPVLGHKPGYEFWRLQDAAEQEGVSQELFNETLNNPDFYQIEDSASNGSHANEKPK